MGLMLGSILYPSISETRTHRFVLWGIRLVAAALAVMAFVLTTRNFCEFSILREESELTDAQIQLILMPLVNGVNTSAVYPCLPITIALGQ